MARALAHMQEGYSGPQYLATLAHMQESTSAHIIILH